VYEQELGNRSQVALSGHDAKICALGERAQSYWMIGARQLANSDLRTALGHERTLKHIASTAHLLDMAALLRFYEAELDGLGRIVERMRAVARVHRLPALAAKALIFTGWLRAKRGRPRSGVEMLRRGLLRLAEIGTEEDFPVYADMLAQALEAQKQYGEALAVLRDAIDQAERNGHTFWLPELYRWRGVIRSRVEGLADAWRRDLQVGCSLARAQGAWGLEMRSIDTLISLDRAAARRTRARRSNIELTIAALYANQQLVTKCVF
jgi:predicted ATPase